MNTPPRQRTPLMLLLIAAALALGALLPAAAAANSAQLTSAARITEEKFGAAFSVTYDNCNPNAGYCGWYPIVHWSPGSTACPTTEPSDKYVVVGSVASTIGTQQVGDYFYATKTTGAINFCVYISHNGSSELAATIPWAGEANPANLTSRQAVSYTKTVLKKKLGKRFKKGTSKKVRCKKSTYKKQKCSVSFKYKGRKYKGTTKVEHYFQGDDLMYSVLYSIRTTR